LKIDCKNSQELKLLTKVIRLSIYGDVAYLNTEFVIWKYQHLYCNKHCYMLYGVI